MFFITVYSDSVGADVGNNDDVGGDDVTIVTLF